MPSAPAPSPWEGHSQLAKRATLGDDSHSLLSADSDSARPPSYNYVMKKSEPVSSKDSSAASTSAAVQPLGSRSASRDALTQPPSQKSYIETTCQTNQFILDLQLVYLTIVELPSHWLQSCNILTQCKYNTGILTAFIEYFIIHFPVTQTLAEYRVIISLDILLVCCQLYTHTLLYRCHITFTSVHITMITFSLTIFLF